MVCKKNPFMTTYTPDLITLVGDYIKLCYFDLYLRVFEYFFAKL